MISSVYNNISALFAFGVKMGVNADNVANAGADGFKRSRADIVQTSEGSVGIEVRKTDTQGALYSEPGDPSVREMSNVDIAEEIAETIPTRYGYEANLKMISVYDEMIGSVINIIK
jgi:flagellar hook protein FlgE